MKHRHKVEQWGITFPKSQGYNKTDFAALFPPSTYSLVCEEQHEDGSPHLHAAIKLTKGISQATMLRWVQGKFPKDWKRIKFEAIKSWDKWHDYCKKEDPCTVTHGKLHADTAAQIAREKMLVRLRDSYINLWGEDSWYEAAEAAEEQRIWQRSQDENLMFLSSREREYWENCV